MLPNWSYWFAWPKKRLCKRNYGAFVPGCHCFCLVVVVAVLVDGINVLLDLLPLLAPYETCQPLSPNWSHRQSRKNGAIVITVLTGALEQLRQHLTILSSTRFNWVIGHWVVVRHEVNIEAADFRVQIQYLQNRVTQQGFPCFKCWCFVFWDAPVWYTRYRIRHHTYFPSHSWHLLIAKAHVSYWCSLYQPRDYYCVDWCFVIDDEYRLLLETVRWNPVTTRYDYTMAHR